MPIDREDNQANKYGGGVFGKGKFSRKTIIRGIEESLNTDREDNQTPADTGAPDIERDENE